MRHRLDLIEVALLVALTALLGWVGGQVWQQRQQRLSADGMLAEGQQTVATFAQRYGPEKNSRNAEEWIIRDFFQDKRGGVFLDVGAAYYQQENNTYFLETGLGWHGLAIDAQATYAEGYRLHRPQTTFFSVFVSDRADEMVDFYVPANILSASHNAATAGNYSNQATTRTRVATTTLNALLEHEHLAHVDFVSLDIELAEPKALAGFDIDRYAPALVCVEVHRSVRQAIIDYFHRHHYEIIGNYIPADWMNFYFMPDRLAATD